VREFPQSWTPEEERKNMRKADIEKVRQTKEQCKNSIRK
jgi:hypothetical protein